MLDAVLLFRTKPAGASYPASRPPARSVLLALGAAVLITAALAPGLTGELLNWDDNRFVEQNPIVHGLSWDNLRAIFARPHQQAYHPLHLLSYCIDYELYGLWAPGYKIHNLLLYLLGLLLLHRLLLRLGLPAAAALAGVLIFGLHPLHVEAVVWVSARKEPLSLCFMLGAALLHLDAGGWRDWRRWLALLLFAAALLTKTSTAVLPLLLLAADLLLRRRTLLPGLLAVGPMLLLALGVGLYVIGLWQDNVMIRPRPQDAGAAAALVLRSLGHHSAKLLLPLRLSPVYFIDRIGRFDLLAAVGLVSLGGLGLALWRLRSPQLRLAAAWWLVALLPVLNLVPVYFQLQDRYAFIPSVALAIAVAGLWEPAQARQQRARALVAVLMVVALVLGLLTALQARHWRSSEALWKRAVTVQSRSYYAHLALGHTLRGAGRPRQAGQSYRRAVKLQPRFAAARIALCLASAQRRGKDGMSASIEQALRSAWLSADALGDLAGSLMRQGQLVCAALAESRAFELRPPSAAQRMAAASRWTLAGQGTSALRHLERITDAELRPRLAPAYYEVRAQALILLGRGDEAQRAFARSLQLAPRSGAALQQAAQQLDRHGRRELARFYRGWAQKIDD